MSHLLNNVRQVGLPVYGCHNAARPVNGQVVLGTEGDIAAMTVWDNAVKYGRVPCIYQRTHDDVMCAGCRHKETRNAA